MKIIRPNTFETNSSSMHALVIMPRDTFDKYDKGEVVLNKRIGMGWNDADGFSLEDDAKEAPKVVLKDKDFITIEDAYNKVVNTDIGEMPKDDWEKYLWEQKQKIIESTKNGGIKNFKSLLKKEAWMFERHFEITTDSQMDEIAEFVKPDKYRGKDVVKIYLVTEC